MQLVSSAARADWANYSLVENKETITLERKVPISERHLQYKRFPIECLDCGGCLSTTDNEMPFYFWSKKRRTKSNQAYNKYFWKLTLRYPLATF